MLRRWVTVGITLFSTLLTGACLRAVEVSPEDALAASEHYGNILIEDKDGILYYAQSIEEGEEGFFKLNMVKVVNDGVDRYLNEQTIAKEEITSIKYYKNNRWVTIGALAALSVFILYIYYSVNTSLLD